MSCKITIVKAFPYRAEGAEEFSNTYMLTGATPANAAAWEALYEGMRAEESTLWFNDTTQPHIVAGYGYDSFAHDAVSVWSTRETVPVHGVLAGVTTQVRAPGDAAMLASWKLDRRNSKGKTVYLHKYYHGALATAGGGDSLAGVQKVALDAVATVLMDGTLPNGRKICDPLGNIPISGGAKDYITTRTLKRRGKRP